MDGITFYTMTRPFEGEFDALQRLAIGSWRGATGRPVQVILMGDDAGTDKAAGDLGVEHYPALPRNERGTLLVNAAFRAAEALAGHGWLCEISSDIVLGADFGDALAALDAVERPFVVGRRWDIDPGAPAKQAVLHHPAAADYFLYRPGTIPTLSIPPFAVGRTAYDNWLIWTALHRWDMTVIDATERITAVHVNHGYPEYGDKAAMVQGAERDENHRLARETGCDRWCGVNDAPFVLARNGVRERAYA